MHKKLIYNGKSSDELGLVIQATPTYEYPSRDVTTTHVPGRNGDVITDNGGYNNVNRTYSLAKGYVKGYGGVESTPPNARAVLNWLNSSHGRYVRLEDEYDPDVYRLATYNSNGSFGDLFDQALTLDVSFNCKPQRYLKYGEKPLTYDGVHQVLIRNPYNFASKPQIKIENLTPSKITMMSVKDELGNESALVSLDKVGESIVIDSENMRCSDADGKLVNEYVNLNGKKFPVLNPEENIINISNYDLDDREANSYNEIINNKQHVLSSEYAPYETIIASEETTFKVPSWESIIVDHSESVQSDSYQSVIEDLVAEGGQTTIYNNEVITTIGQHTVVTSEVNQIPYTESVTLNYSITGGYDEKPAFISFIKVQGSRIYTNFTDSYKATFPQGVVPKAYYKVNNDRIQLYEDNQELVSSKDATIYFYPAHHVEYNYYELDALNYWNASLPDWLEVQIVIDSPSGNRPYLSAINFISKRNGYIWHDKKLFSPAGWSFQAANSELLGFDWRSTKGEFRAIRGIWKGITSLFSNNSDDEFTLKYLDKNNVPQLATNIVDVTIPDTDNADFKEIQLNYKRIGYYRLNKGNGIGSWVQCTNPAASTSNIRVNSSSAFTIQYISDIPTYRMVPNWPQWLDDRPYMDNDGVKDPADLNTINIYLKLKPTAAEGYFRKHITDDAGNEVTNDWHEYSVESIPGGDFITSRNDNITIGYMSKDPSSYPINYNEADRLFKIDDSPLIYEENTHQDLGNWCDYELTMSILLDRESSDEENHKAAKRYPLYDDVWDEEFTGIGHKRKVHPYYCWYYNDANNDPVYFFTENVMCPSIGGRIFEAHEVDDKWVYYGATIGKVYQEASIKYFIPSDGIESGIYRIDNDVNWVKHTRAATPTLLEGSGNVDSVIIRYLGSTLPEYKSYSEFEFEVPEYLDCEVSDNGEGNPTEIIMKIKKPIGQPDQYKGYYRVNTNVNWKEFSGGDELCRVNINEITTIHHLEKTDDEVQVDVTIIPNWWIL